MNHEPMNAVKWAARKFHTFMAGFNVYGYTYRQIIGFQRRALELWESRGRRIGLPDPNSPYSLCGRKATQKKVFNAQLIHQAIPWSTFTDVRKNRDWLLVRKTWAIKSKETVAYLPLPPPKITGQGHKTVRRFNTSLPSSGTTEVLFIPPSFVELFFFFFFLKIQKDINFAASERMGVETQKPGGVD